MSGFVGNYFLVKFEKLFEMSDPSMIHCLFYGRPSILVGLSDLYL